MAKKERSPILTPSPFTAGITNSGAGNINVTQNKTMPITTPKFPGMPEGPCPVGPRDPANK